MRKKIIAVLIITLLMMNFTVYAASEEKAITDETVEGKEENLLSLDECIKLGLKNSLLLQQVKNQSEIAKLVADNAPDVKNSLNDGAGDLSAANYLIEDGRDKIYDSETQLGSAQAALANGIAPVDIPISKPEYHLETTIPAGAKIYDYLKKYYQGIGLSSEAAAGYASQITPEVEKGAQAILDGKGNELQSSKKKLEESTQEYLSSKSKYDAAVQFAMANVADKLSTSTISSLKARPLGELIVKMADAQDEITNYSLNIYRNQVALLIENNYFEALKQQKLLEVKDKAVERGSLQYELAEAAYEVGAKSRDDMLLAKSYYDSTLMSRDLQIKDYNTALINLKKSINMDLSKEIKLVPVEANESEHYDLKQGMSSGSHARLEIKMAETQMRLCDNLLTAVKDSEYYSCDNQYKEVELLQKKAQITLDGAKLQVEGDIRTSYETMNAMQKVVERAKQLKKSAEENVEIARVKYEVGYGYDNALLKQLNLQDLSGTLVEVIAAEENFTNIEEKEIEAINGYNLARLKYLNDIGILPY